MKQSPIVDFKCEDCELEFASQSYIYMRLRYISGTVYKAKVPCPSCSAEVVREFDKELPLPSGRKPTKRIVVGQEEYFIHGRDRTVVPADLKEVLGEEE